MAAIRSPGDHPAVGSEATELDTLLETMVAELATMDVDARC